MAERNLNLDIIRGIAAFSVVANYVLSHFEGFAGSMIGNINFSLQNYSNEIIHFFGGQYLLELYVVHYVMMRFPSPGNTPITAINGFLEFFGYYVVVLAITALLIEVINTNKTFRFILFGKTK